MHEPVPEFSRIIYVARLSPNGVIEKLQAKPDERAALAERFELIELPKLAAELTVQPGMQGSVKVSGKLAAIFMQRCVVTLEPLPGKMTLDIDVTFLPAEENADGAGPADEPEEEIEFYENGRIDIGEMVAQQFAVNLDPYPRKPGAALPKTSFSTAPKKPQPFAQLAELAKKTKKQDKTKE